MHCSANIVNIYRCLTITWKIKIGNTFDSKNESMKCQLFFIQRRFMFDSFEIHEFSHWKYENEFSFNRKCIIYYKICLTFGESTDSWLYAENFIIHNILFFYDYYTRNNVINHPETRPVYKSLAEHSFLTVLLL